MILLLGSTGLLGKHLEEKFVTKKIPFISVSRNIKESKADFFYNLDLETDINGLYNILKTHPEIDYIINTSGFTAVDGAETKPFEAIKGNIYIPMNISFANILLQKEQITTNKKSTRTQLIQISTDYIFEDNGLGVYGYTKKIAENILINEFFGDMKVTIGRTSSLYGNTKGFIKYVVKSLTDNKPVRALTDQVTSPTFAGELADQIIFLITNKLRPTQPINLVGKESMSRYECACRVARYFNLNSNLIEPVSTTELHLVSPRPLKNHIQDISYLQSNGFVFQSFENCLSELKKDLLHV